MIYFIFLQQYFNNSNDNFDGYELENDKKYQLNGNTHCVEIDCMLICTCMALSSNWQHLNVYQLTKLQNFISLCMFTTVVDQYYNLTMKLYHCTCANYHCFEFVFENTMSVQSIKQWNIICVLYTGFFFIIVGLCCS